MPCPACGCEADAASHAVSALLREDDMDAALDQGLLEVEPCATCTGQCTSTLLNARDERLRALDARERYRARTERLAVRAEARKQKRAAAQVRPASLPPAAAAALARALARAGKTR